ncbi:hypothetical protein TCE0_044r17199 [Talaromyces pinophilus]|uniref:cyclin-dependent kinase n=1 Tax=Talaromyces pinophilus TaxID=128442 RepID=A0A478EBW4_TALPI|nr:hypothetical protein TCE0_044r17199 [Talaromyces pinophilus]
MAEDWRASYGFSKRFKRMSEITSAYRNLSPSSTFAEAQPHSAPLEREAYAKATSEVEYDRLCQEIIDGFEAQHAKVPVIESQKVQSVEQAENEPVEATAAVKIGAYENCVHHADGLMSTIYRSKRPDSSLVALKVTTPHQMSPPHDSKREARIIRWTKDHKHIIPLLETFNLAGGRFVLVFPFMRYNFAEVLRQNVLTILQIKVILRDMFRGLEHVHALRIIHRDVKPSNILLDSLDGPAYLADFGISWKETDEGSEPAKEKIIDVGTTSYRPPEILFGSTEYDTSLDMWAAGCVVAEAVDMHHRQLFDSGDLGSELALIKSIFTTLGTPNAQVWPESARLPDWGKFQFHEYPAKPWEEVLQGASTQGRDLVSKLICYESSSRLTAEQALRHPFLPQKKNYAEQDD